jgi:hypothetical protein
MLWVCAGESPAHSCCSWKEKMKAEKEYKTCTHLNSNLGDFSEPTSLQRCIGHIVTPDSRLKASEMLILTEGIAVHGLICGIHLGGSARGYRKLRCMFHSRMGTSPRRWLNTECRIRIATARRGEKVHRRPVGYDEVRGVSLGW